MVTRHLLRDESGATAVVIGLSMTALLGFAGMAVDVGVWYADKRAAQGAADSAAYSAAVDYSAGDTTAGAKTAGQAVAAQYGYTNGVTGVTVTVNTPPTSGTHTATTGAMEVIVTKTESLFFSSFFVSSAKVSARAVATPGTGGAYCVLALDTSNSTTVSTADVGESGATIVDTSNCGVAINAPGSDALSLTGSSQLKAKTLSIVGNYTVTGGSSVTVTGSKTTGASPVSDPYANVATPSPGTCAPTNSWGNGTTATINPGTYCNGLSLAGGATITMNPGVYVINQGLFNVSNGATVTGAGVTIVLTSSTGSNYATANISGGTTTTLTAPTSGATSGMVFLQDRRDNSGATSSISNGAQLSLTGAMYFPSQQVSFSGGTSTSSQCTQLIAFRVTYSGSATFNNNCTGVGVSGIGASSTALVE